VFHVGDEAIEANDKPMRLGKAGQAIN
jgi:hypothetical protein